jgi:VCBS repeat-containing protein
MKQDSSKIDWESWAKSEFSDSTSTPVLCKDGTYDYELNSSNARIDNSKTCINKGGRAETFFKVVCNDGTTQMVSNQTKEGVSNLACTKNGGISKNQTIVVKPTTDEVKQQNLNLASRGDVMTQEDKFYEMLGIKKTNGGWGIQSRPMGRILVAVFLVAGYFAYKKYKK